MRNKLQFENAFNLNHRVGLYCLIKQTLNALY